MLDLILLPFHLAWELICAAFQIVWGLLSLVFGLLSGLMELFVSIAGIVLVAALIRLAMDRRRAGKAYSHAKNDDFRSFYDQDGTVE